MDEVFLAARGEHTRSIGAERRGAFFIRTKASPGTTQGIPLLRFDFAETRSAEESLESSLVCRVAATLSVAL